MALAAVLLAAGCGGDDDDGQARTVESGAAETTTTTEKVEEVSGDVGDVIVQLDDLPTGWAVSPEEPDEEGDTEEECAGGDPPEDFPNAETAESQFQQSDFGPFVGSSAFLFDEEAQADDAFEEFATALPRCDGFTQTDEDGATTTYSVEPLSFPDLGEETFAARMSGDTIFGPLSMDIVVARKGPILIFLANGGFGAAATDLSEQLVRTMVDRA